MTSFDKVEGLGNDFVLLDRRQGGEAPSAEWAAMVCDRRRGVGADGVLTLLPAEGDGDLRLLIHNADGSVPEMCGNGLRCVVAALQPERTLRVETGAGLRLGRLEADGRVWITLGEGRLADAEVPLGLEHDGCPALGRAVDMGNPHLVLRIDGPATDLWALAGELGPRLEGHPAFPHRVNVGFARPTSSGLELVVFERGAGLTQACGTGAAAAALVASTWGPTEPEIRVRLPGGELGVRIPEHGPIEMVGPARVVFRGQL